MSEPSQSSPDRTRQRVAVAWAIGIFAALSVSMAWASKGFLEGDACTHYIYQRHCLHERYLMTDVWGRPLCTLGYAFAAALGGRFGVRFQMMLTAVAMGLVTMRIARNQGYRWPGLALIFLLAQPIVFLHSFSELTELPFGLLVALALWAYQTRQWFWLALVVGIMPTGRPEGFGFVALAGLALLLHRRWWWIPVLLLPLATWSFAGWWLTGATPPWYIKGWTWLRENWPYASQSLYARGWLVHFLVLLPAVTSPFVFPAMWVGVWRSFEGGLARSGQETGAWHRRCVQWVIAAIPLGILAGHSLLYWRGKMASNGELRYMAVAAPMWALLGALGWETVFERMRWRRMFLWAGLAALAPIGANLAYQVVPIKLDKTGLRSQQVAEWFRSTPLREKYPRILATPRDVYYFLDISPTDRVKSGEWHRRTIEEDSPARDGVMLVWDPVYGVFNSDAARSIRAEEVLKAGWVPIRVYNVQPGEMPEDTAINRLARKIQHDDLGDWVIFLSPKDKDGRPTDPALAVPMPPAERMQVR